MTDIGLEYGLAEGNYLRPNGLGGYVISASAISSWSRCQLQRFYELRSRHDPEAPRAKQLSATAFGSVVHGAVMQMELAAFEGHDDPLSVGLNYFEFYWHPTNISAICPPVEHWLPAQTFGGLRERGRLLLEHYFEILMKDNSFLLAVEYEFAVPLEIRGRTHTLVGTIDRLAFRQHYRKPYVSVDDLKTGKRPSYLRYNTQGGFYAYATTQPEFWTGWPESGVDGQETFPAADLERFETMMTSWGYRLHAGQEGDLPLASRRFRWIDLKDVKFCDGGWRVGQDYARLMLGVDAYVRACEAEIYAINTDGEVCRYCSFMEICGGVGLPKESVGAP